MPRDARPDHHRLRGGFRNPWPTAVRHGLREFLRWVTTYDRRPDPTRWGSQPLATPAFASPLADPTSLSLTWVGHSTYLIQIGGRNVLTDPMWGRRASPVTWAGPGRVMPSGIPFDTLPPIHAVVQSHDHYDHLDATTVRRLAAAHPDARWHVPLGVGAWVRRRGVRLVEEMDWWDARSADGLTMTCTPAQHFSGRGLRRDPTLWAGWVVAGGGRRAYFVGDTGYFPAFPEIGRRAGPFDAVLVPIGAYDPRWFMRPAHMNPEEAVRAYVEVTRGQDGALPPMAATHWGTFKLTEEPLPEPPRRARAAWHHAGLPDEALWIFRHGETRWIGGR